jgi:hypothetical protein
MNLSMYYTQRYNTKWKCITNFKPQMLPPMEYLFLQLKDFINRDALYCVHKTIESLDDYCGMCNQPQKEDEILIVSIYCKDCLCRKGIKNCKFINYPNGRFNRFCNSCDKEVPKAWNVNVCIKCDTDACYTNIYVD